MTSQERPTELPVKSALHNKLTHAALLGVGLAFCASASAQTDVFTALQKSEPTGRLIVSYVSEEKPWQSPRGRKKFVRQSLRTQQNLTLKRKLSDTLELVQTNNTDNSLQTLKAQAQALGSQSNVRYASVEYRRYPLLQPNDPLYQGSQSPGNQSYLYEGEYSLHAPGAWDITTGAPSSVIAIVDTGVLPNHPEITNQTVTTLGYDFVSADLPNDYTSANDGDGRDPSPVDPGDACNGFPSSWHGTAVASAAAGNSNNADGLAGIDWNARVLHARALGICGGTDADIIDAIRWSAGLPVAGIPDNPTPANVVNLSLGGETECTKAWQEVIDELADRNVIFVMAAGNESNNALRTSPANCANVITVGSNTPDGDIDLRVSSLDQGFSNYGLKVTTTTQGRDIVVASNRGFNEMDPDGDFYLTETGTSFSAALVSGAISLMHALNPDLSTNDVRAILQQSATPYAAGTKCDQFHCGGGVMNAARALSSLRDNNFDPQIDTARDLIENESTPILLQQGTNAALFGNRDIRYFSVGVPERGLLQAESTSDEDLYAYLLNTDLSVIALDDDAGEANNFRVASLVDPGTYYIAVERSIHRPNDGEVAFTLQTSLSNDAPTAFTFTPITNATGNSVVQSNSVTISGLQGESVLTVSDGFYSLNRGDLSNTPTTINNGDTLRIATQSLGNASGTSTTIVTVGAYSTVFAVTTRSQGGTDGTTNTGGGRSGCTASGGAPFDPLFLLMLLVTCIGISRRTAVR